MGAGGIVPAVVLVEICPEAVVHPVQADLDHDEELPRPSREQMLCEPESSVRHLVDLAEEVVLVVRAVVRAVEQILPDHPLDLPREERRVRKPALTRGR